MEKNNNRKRTVIWGLALLLLPAHTLCQQNKVARIQYSGLQKTKARFIAKISIVTLANADSATIEKDIQYLKRLPSIANVSYRIQKDSLGNPVLHYHFEENHTLLPIFAVWMGIPHTSFRAGATDFNLLGSNKSLGFFYQYNAFHSYHVFFTDPFLFSKKWGLSFSHVNLTSQEPLYFSNAKAQYRYQNKSFELLALFRPRFNHHFLLGATLFRERYMYLSGFENNDIPKKITLQKTLVKLGYDYNQLNYHYFYVSGTKNQLLAQHILAPYPFWVVQNDFHHYKRMGKKGNWATRVRLGLSSNENTPFAPFAMDNNLNIRGVGNIVARGTGKVILNTEYRHTLYTKRNWVLQSNTFIDMGSFRNPGGRIADFTQSSNISTFGGLGLRLIHKRIFGAILRIDYGVNLRDINSKGLVFGIGQYF
jgi:outer membrane protein assembly factor BamA